MQVASTNTFRSVVSIVNTAIGSICLLLLSLNLAVFVGRLLSTRRLNKSWSALFPVIWAHLIMWLIYARQIDNHLDAFLVYVLPA